MKTWNALTRPSVVAAAALALTSAVHAGITDPAMTVTASNSLGSGQFIVFLANGTWSSGGTVWEWQSGPGGYDIFNSEFQVVAHVDNLYCKMVADPQVIVNFSVSANSSATNFSFTTGVLSFPTINTPFGRATAGITVTDNDSDGAALTGLHAGGNSYRANYNGAIPGGSTFANLVGSFAAPVDDSATNSGAAPPVGYLAIGSPVSDMQGKFDFQLSANDSASGTSFYEIIPAPASSLVLAGAGLAVIRRRRPS
jgi:hypothetical protein